MAAAAAAAAAVAIRKERCTRVRDAGHLFMVSDSWLASCTCGSLLLSSPLLDPVLCSVLGGSWPWFGRREGGSWIVMGGGPVVSRCDADEGPALEPSETFRKICILAGFGCVV